MNLDSFDSDAFEEWLEDDQDSILFAVPDDYGVEDLKLARAFFGRSQNSNNYNFQ
ncbi:hypothetical protein ACSQ5K_26565 [Pseudomonas sp. PhalM4]